MSEALTAIGANPVRVAAETLWLLPEHAIWWPGAPC